VFLAGDAAHRLQPNGAFGLNTGVQDVHNLAWKLWGVLSGWAGDGLLDTYETERRPIALPNAELSRLFWDSGSGSAPGYVMGYTYPDGAVVPDGTDPPVLADPVADYIPTARPGSRAPHWWLSTDHEDHSSLDLFDHRFVLLTDRGNGPLWSAAAHAAAQGLPVTAIQPPDAEWMTLYGIQTGGAVLVRPDGHVAWRASRPAAGFAGRLLGDVLDRIRHSPRSDRAHEQTDAGCRLGPLHPLRELDH
jgi:putative polyketide hydroxylase